MKLIEGTMAAVSAGMLIYAACVEMIAGDFVMDSTLWKSSIRKQVLAIGSLIVGAGAMASVAYVVIPQSLSLFSTDDVLLRFHL